MGAIKVNLSKTTLPKREMHHSRLFIDLAENVHIHHREFRTVFSLSEFFEYADIITKSAQEINCYIANNRDYRESQYPTTLLIAGGKNQQLKFLRNSPSPNESQYFDKDLTIELQEEYVTDEIHIHYRDFRIAIKNAWILNFNES